MASTDSFETIAVVPSSLEDPAVAELIQLGAREVRPLLRAVSCRTELAGFYRLHLQARLPFRLLRRLARFPCRDRRDLAAGVAGAADWEQWLPPELSFRVEVSGSAPGLSHSHYTALEVKNVLVDRQRQRWGRRSSVDLDIPDIVLHLHLGGGEGVLSLEGSGGSLHRRGYRAAMGGAPLKENLAAGLIRLTGWDGGVPLLDPLCGSGTLLIEAVGAALGRAPGLMAGLGEDVPGHGLSLANWPDFDPLLWRREREAAARLRRDHLADGRPLASVVGIEHDPAVLAQARANAAAAGIEDHLQLLGGDARELEAPGGGPGLLVCNPPYGARLGAGDDLPELYAALGRRLKDRFAGWTLWLLSGNPELSRCLGMKAERRIPISNGGIECRWLKYTIR